MLWAEKCIMDMTHHNLFENDGQRSRFRDLLECYVDAPFFKKGLCKCMYLASWDEDSFAKMLDILNTMTIRGSRSLREMKEEFLTAEADTDGDEEHIGDHEKARLYLAFLNDASYECPNFSHLEIMDPEAAYCIKRSLKAAICIDDV